MDVTLANQQWKVIDAGGNFEEADKESLVGVSLPQTREAPHWEFPAVKTDVSTPEGSPQVGIDYAGYGLWVVSMAI